MSEILLCVKTRWQNTGNLIWESKQFKQGDVMVVKPDGWGWGAAEIGGRLATALDQGFQIGDRVWQQPILGGNGQVIGTSTQLISQHPLGNHNFFRVVQLPNVTVAQASTLLAPEQDMDSQNPSPYLQPRAKFIDRSLIPANALASFLDDDTRSAPVFTINLTAAQLNNFVSVRPAIPFP